MSLNDFITAMKAAGDKHLRRLKAADTAYGDDMRQIMAEVEPDALFSDPFSDAISQEKKRLVTELQEGSYTMTEGDSSD